MATKGSCHCGRIAFVMEDAPTEALECNCSLCRRRGNLLAFTTPERFSLKTPREEITVYTWNKQVIRHQFCRTCGCAPFAEGVGPNGKPMVAINLRCADIDLSRITIKPFDGAHQLDGTPPSTP